jgi:hypothetical protein
MFAGCRSVFFDAHDASDIFVQLTTSAGGTADSYDLWRSRDGGTMWRKLGAVTETGYRLVWAQLAVLGSRLVGQVDIDQEGALQNALYSSDDGGMTWQPFAQSVASQGYTIFGFTVITDAVWINTVDVVGTAGLSAAMVPEPSRSHSAISLLDAPTSGQPSDPPTWWRSLDGGATWSKVSLPSDSALTTLMATLAYGGQGSYALSVTWSTISGDSQPPVYDAALWWSANGGASWKLLLDLRGAERGYVIAGAAMALGPDGSVFASARHAPGGSGDDAGIFRIQPADAAASWLPLVAGGTQACAATETSTGLRLWGIGAYGPDSNLEYVRVL